MKTKNLSIIFTIVFILMGCDNNKETDADKEIEAIQRELSQIESELKELEEMNPDKIDRNGDGQADLFIEFEGEFVYELIDRDFDGQVDESWKYDSNANLVSGKVDENLDGILETQYISKDHSIDKIFSDSDGNGVFDVYTKLDRGVLVFSERYYSSEQQAKIGKVEYEYGYPKGPEILTSTPISEEEFQEKRK
ncbi:hypothetical protein [Kangiella aquimarina]|uniref:Lipoprotein n=1 Tax=Kangiella aquimarina TaxID=261965 RepID=A0ABZ0X1D9_9GAMM|nr:hypothetical protein [Kangiella aquimarina]WQG84375.1 hypothetical protein SR900_07845 [Kangiella aquimarina]